MGVAWRGLKIREAETCSHIYWIILISQDIVVFIDGLLL